MAPRERETGQIDAPSVDPPGCFAAEAACSPDKFRSCYIERRTALILAVNSHIDHSYAAISNHDAFGTELLQAYIGTAVDENFAEATRDEAVHFAFALDVHGIVRAWRCGACGCGLRRLVERSLEQRRAGDCSWRIHGRMPGAGHDDQLCAGQATSECLTCAQRRDAVVGAP